MCDDEKPPCKHITTLHTYNTEFNADSVEWCPHEPNQDVFVCANYQLKESDHGDHKRIGCILLFTATVDNLTLNQTLYTVAILDQKWCHNKINDHSILAVATAEKTIEIYRLNPEVVELELIVSHKFEDDTETLVLSLDWSTGKFESNEPQLTCSDSQGRVHILTLKNNELVLESSKKSHDFETWITAFYYWDPNIFFSGGDDCYFLKYDKRVGLEAVGRNRSHEAGVTAMHSNSEKEYVLATGSYDTHVRLWDIRYLKNCTNSVKTPGTLWRLKWDPLFKKYLLAACMWGGIHILNGESENLEIVDSYYKHENICYGSDWSYSPRNSNNGTLLATCSFYDNLLSISQVQLDI